MEGIYKNNSIIILRSMIRAWTFTCTTNYYSFQAHSLITDYIHHFIVESVNAQFQQFSMSLFITNLKHSFVTWSWMVILYLDHGKHFWWTIHAYLFPWLLYLCFSNTLAVIVFIYSASFMNISCYFAFNLIKNSPLHCTLIRSFEFNAQIRRKPCLFEFHLSIYCLHLVTSMQAVNEWIQQNNTTVYVVMNVIMA